MANSSNENLPIQIELAKHRFSSIAEEMGVILRMSSYSPNIKERRDYSCAIFDGIGEMVSQAAHIPVHLGSMPLSVKSAIENIAELRDGDVIALNDPFNGGTHLPDITMISPVFINGDDEVPFAFVASRAHHADVGGASPGSMAISTEIYQEGIIIPPIKIVEGGKLSEQASRIILANVRTANERLGDLRAQMAANKRGVLRLKELASRYGAETVQDQMDLLMDYSEALTKNLLSKIPKGVYTFTDYMDDDGLAAENIPITVAISIQDRKAIVDFTGSAEQQPGSINAVFGITLSAVFYVFRCLLGIDVPNNSGCIKPIDVIAPPGSIVNAKKPAAVAAGNVETSQRIVDVLLGALSKALPERIPAASQGTMNNITIGGFDPEKDRYFAYYETIGGGTGALPNMNGVDAIHSHMTNTLNTPIEALEYEYPFQVMRYEIREESGGRGKYRGGNGIVRSIKVLTDSKVTLLTERRRLAPYGLNGGQPGKRGQNILVQGEKRLKLAGKGSFSLKRGDIITIETPGGGGYGDVEEGAKSE